MPADPPQQSLQLGFATVPVPYWLASVKPPFDFYGACIVVNHGAPDTVTYHGGYQPYPLNEYQLQPWIRMAIEVLARRVFGEPPGELEEFVPANLVNMVQEILERQIRDEVAARADSKPARKKS